MPHIRTLQRTPLLSVGDGRFLKVEQHVVAFGDGQQVDDWPWVITPDFVNVVPVLGDGRILCFRQEKYAADGLTLGVPGGYLEAGEEPLPAARRELLEETGYAGGRWMPTSWTATAVWAAATFSWRRMSNGASRWMPTTWKSWSRCCSHAQRSVQPCCAASSRSCPGQPASPWRFCTWGRSQAPTRPRRRPRRCRRRAAEYR
jgi:hypothetical protein